MNTERVHGHRSESPGPEKGDSIVDVWIGRESKSIHRGSHPVADLKALLDVPEAKELDQFVDGELVPLADDGRVTIKGGEHFVAHERRGRFS